MVKHKIFTFFEFRVHLLIINSLLGDDQWLVDTIFGRNNNPTAFIPFTILIEPIKPEFLDKLIN